MSGLKTLDSVIDASGIFQRSLMPNLFRGLPASTLILGMTFLAPKIQNFHCASDPYMMDSSLENATHDIRSSHCYSGGQKTCSEWSFDASVFENTFKSEFSTVCQWEWILDFSDSLVMVGVMLGNLGFSHISDWYGRKVANVGSALFSLVGAIAMAASPNVIMFVILRTITAAGLGGGQVSTFTLAMETVKPTMRYAVPFCDYFGWILGILLLPLAPWFYRKNWRHLQLIYSLSSVPLLVMSIITDESPRWLLATGRTKQARPVIKRLLRNSGMPNSDENVEEVITSTVVTAKDKSKVNIGDLLNNKTIALTTASFLIQYVILNLTYYDLMFFVINVGDNIWMNVVCTGLFEIPVLFIVAFLVEYGPRKMLYLIVYLTSGISVGLLFFTREDQEILRGALAVIAKTGVQVLFPIVNVHVNETYITRKRGIAMGLGTTFSRVGAVIAPSLKPFSSGIHAIVNASACLIALASSLPLKETFKKPLPEVEDVSSPPKREDSGSQMNEQRITSAVIGSSRSESDTTEL